MSRKLHRSLFCAALAAPTLAAGAAHADRQESVVATVDTTLFPGAVCNNGEPATFNYILTDDDGPGDDGVDHRRKWLVVLSGGGECHDLESCRARWLESPTGPNRDGGPGDHFNMVPDEDARNFEDHGLLDFDGEVAEDGTVVDGNPFRGTDGTDGFNRVWINYCSSDGWQGLGTSIDVSHLGFPQVPFDPDHPRLTRLHFGGARIVDAVIATIMRGEVRDGDGNLRPDLVPAGPDGELVLAGSSAGGFGTLRNLDTVAREVHHGIPRLFDGDHDVVVWGIPDAATTVGPIPVPLGEAGYDAADFYTGGHPALVRDDDDCDPAGTTRCYDVGSYIAEHWISTPYFVVQQAYDMTIHRPLKEAIAAAIRKHAADLATLYPQLALFAVASFDSPDDAAEAYIRFMITTSADRIGADLGNPAGLFIPDYETGWHQLLTNSYRFYTSPAHQWHGVDAHGDALPGDPRLGPVYAGTTEDIPTALASFRRCVLGDWGTAPSYASCVTRLRLLGAVDENARVINTTAIPLGLVVP